MHSIQTCIKDSRINKSSNLIIINLFIFKIKKKNMKVLYISITIFVFFVALETANGLQCYSCANCDSISSASTQTCSAGDVCSVSFFQKLV